MVNSFVPNPHANPLPGIFISLISPVTSPSMAITTAISDGVAARAADMSTMKVGPLPAAAPAPQPAVTASQGGAVVVKKEAPPTPPPPPPLPMLQQQPETNNSAAGVGGEVATTSQVDSNSLKGPPNQTIHTRETIPKPYVFMTHQTIAGL